jgi:hypothetical protein
MKGRLSVLALICRNFPRRNFSRRESHCEKCTVTVLSLEKTMKYLLCDAIGNKGENDLMNMRGRGNDNAASSHDFNRKGVLSGG